LQAGQVDHVRDAVLVNRLTQSCQIGDIAGMEVDPAEQTFIEKQAQTMGILLEIVDPDVVATLEQVADDPAADAPIAAGQEYAHRMLLRSDNAQLSVFEFPSSASAGTAPAPLAGSCSSAGLGPPAASSVGEEVPFSSRATLASDAILSPSFRFMMRTPCV